MAEHKLAAAVSNAGGLGLIGAASAPADWVRDQVRKAKELTDKPFGVNIMLMSPYADEVAKVIVEEGVKVVTTGAGKPGKGNMKMVERSGRKSDSCCGKRWLWQREWNACGADAWWQKAPKPVDISVRIRRWYSCLRWWTRSIFR